MWSNLDSEAPDRCCVILKPVGGGWVVGSPWETSECTRAPNVDSSVGAQVEYVIYPAYGLPLVPSRAQLTHPAPGRPFLSLVHLPIYLTTTTTTTQTPPST
jgi:hypothetical protein